MVVLMFRCWCEMCCGCYDFGNRCILRVDVVKQTIVFLPLVPNSFKELNLFGSKVNEIFECDSPRIPFACWPPKPMDSMIGTGDVTLGMGYNFGETFKKGDFVAS